jgi:hypothetical protein
MLASLGLDRPSPKQTISEVREMVWEWLKLRGPVSDWASILLFEIEQSKRNGTIEALLREMKSDREIGKVLAKDLRGILDARLPTDEKMLKDLMRQIFDLLSTLLSGISVLDNLVELSAAME